MPKYQTQVLLDLLYAIECGKEWPSSLLVGLVHSLEKIPNASKISQYRPITLFSVIYRCWSSIVRFLGMFLDTPQQDVSEMFQIDRHRKSGWEFKLPLKQPIMIQQQSQGL